MTTTFRVRKKIGKDGSTGYKYYSAGYEWNLAEIEECERVSFIFSDSMDYDDKVKVKEKWKHKMHHLTEPSNLQYYFA